MVEIFNFNLAFDSSFLKAINLQIEVTKFVYNCLSNSKSEPKTGPQAPTLFGTNDTKINLCSLILLSGKTIQEGFGFVIRIIQVGNKIFFVDLKNNLIFFVYQVFQSEFDACLFANRE